MSASKNGGPQFQERGRSESPFGVVATAHYDSGPPASKFILSDEDGDVVETVREEEWEERRKKTTTTTKNVERRVQRQLVLEDGEVVGDSGPVITEDTTTDKVTNEVVSDQNQRPEGQLAIEPPEGEGWVATPGAIIISEKCTKTVKSHDEVEDELETEEVQHCGDVTNKEAEEHLQGQTDLRELIAHRKNSGKALAIKQKKVVHEATRRRGNIDTVDVKESSRIKDGHVITETERNVVNEQYDNESAPDSGSSLSDGSVHEATKETSHNLVHTKDEDLLEYYAVPKGATLAQGVKIGEGMHVVSEDVHEDRQGNDNDEAAERLKKIRRPGRRDALTKKPLDYGQEEATRKTETNKWLEHHFGSESGRSEDSFNEDSNDRIHSSGGNRITITMSPHPVTNEDVPDSTSPARHWAKDSTKASTPKGPPPPPPPKPDRIWSARTSSPTSPISPISQSISHQARDIQESELAAARSRLRSTGKSLTEENKENNEPEPTKFFDAGRSKAADSSIHSPTFATPSNNKYSSLKNDVIYSSKFRSGHPKKGYAPPAPESYVSPTPITNVGRSQSFHVQTLPWSSLKKESSSKNYKSSMKDYRSEERLDDIDTRRNYRNNSTYDSWKADRTSYSYKPNDSGEKSWKIKKSWSPPREPTPPPPPRQSRKSPVNKSYSSFDNYGREAATQTGPSPIPPPRTKRKKKPKNSYFFGQENGVSTHTGTSMQNGLDYRHSTHEPYYSNNYSSENRYYNEHTSSKRSPKIEKRYKTTKTITPVLVIPYEERSERYKNRDYSSQNLNKSSWTNTVDPRRRPRVVDEEERSTTLPRKFSSSTSLSPRKTYLFGESDPNEHKYSNRYSSTHIESTNNVSTNHFDSDTDYNRFSSLNNRLNNKTNKSVGRSQSFNIQAGKSNPHGMSNGRTFSEIRDHKTSAVYGSTPYVNLRSPNLIANIARTSSTRRLDSNDINEYANQNDEYNDNREKFMKGLLDNAPELYHFIHGNENEDQSQKREHIIRPTVDVSSPYSPPATKSPNYSARIFTFGKSDTNKLTRTSSQGPADDENKRNSLNNSYTADNYQRSSATEENNKRNYILSNPSSRKSTFNLKTSGSSLLYSPSFRSQQQEAEEKRKREKERLSGDFSRTGMEDDNPVLIQIRDWNMR